ncbi:S41 family peptidase [Kitasatospora sp. NPDC048540]|uniref:S41 family peptidase n=1 Tax=unclassified Kitasatospora TaxID=2633591 RepID=UPI0005397F16|nr:S41 family peptidase [Kitasatospora sp. MBT63]
MTTHHAILEDALTRITAGYVFPDRAAEADAEIRRRLAAGEYEGLAVPDLCTAVTGHLQQVCPDKHLRLVWREEPQPLEEDEDADAAFSALCRSENQGVRRVERLDGNIGYLDLRLIATPADGAEMFAAAMRLVAGTEALVIDLRHNRGGSPEGVALWCSYFFADGEVHLNDVYERTSGRTRQFWTSGHLPAPRYLDRPVRVLTSASTFSGGEELAYNLKVQQRATLIGETTRGGAHPTEWYPLTPHVTVTVPTSRSINPVTGTNWEGVGVVPDVAVPAELALETALEGLAGELA